MPDIEKMRQAKAVEDALRLPPGRDPDIRDDEYLLDDPTTHKDQPQQGMLFTSRGKAFEEALSGLTGAGEAGTESVRAGISATDMPRPLVKVIATHVHRLPASMRSAGAYDSDSDSVGINPRLESSGPDLSHELGHRADSLVHQTAGVEIPPSETHLDPTSVSDKLTDARREGIADGMEERYTKSPGGYVHHRWGSVMGPVYRATQAHFRETGVAHPAGDNTNDLTIPRYLHRLLSESPAALEAVRGATKNGEYNAGIGLANKFQESRKVGTQMSLIPDMEHDVYDLPEGHKNLNLDQFKDV